MLPSKAYEAWEEQARWDFRRTNPGFKPLECDLDVCAICYYRGAQPDLSGAMESVGDAMESFLWKNDRQIKSWDGSRLIHDKDNPRTVIIVKPFKGGAQ